MSSLFAHALPSKYLLLLQADNGNIDLCESYEMTFKSQRDYYNILEEDFFCCMTASKTQASVLQLHLLHVDCLLVLNQLLVQHHMRLVVLVVVACIVLLYLITQKYANKSTQKVLTGSTNYNFVINKHKLSTVVRVQLICIYLTLSKAPTELHFVL